MGRKTYVFGIIVAVALPFGILFLPLIALLVWAPLIAIQWMRRGR